MYQYCANNPISYADPSGHNICLVQRALYNKYKKMGLLPKVAYDRMRSELGLSKENPFTENSQGGMVSTYVPYYRDKNGMWHRPNGDFASNAELGLPSSKDNKADGTHRNSLSSPEPNHVYVIVDENGKLVKVGISGQPLNRDGTSPRANPQVAKFTKNGMKTRAIIVETNLTRIQALALEQKITDKHAARNNGKMPSQYHEKPRPRALSIEEYVTIYKESANHSTGGRY